MAVLPSPCPRRRRTSAVPALAGAVLTGWLVAAAAPIALAGHLTDTAGSPHEVMIHRIVDAGVSAGCDASGTRYCPELPVTRGQMASFLTRALRLPPGESDQFPDDDGSVHEAAVNRLREEGVTLGRPDGTFDPDGLVDRAQMASFLARAFAVPPADAARFTDVAGVHAANINAIAAAGITAGCDATGTRYCPDSWVLRGQMASFLGRAMGVGGTEPASDPVSGLVSDLPSAGGASGSTAVAPVDPGPPPPAEPGQPEPEYVAARAVADVAEVDPSEAVAAWSPERLADAEGLTPDPTPLTAAPLVGGITAAEMYPGEPVLAGSSSWATRTEPALGRLFAQKPDGRTGFCSGTVVSETLVLTAAHCVVDLAGTTFTDIVFVPGTFGTDRSLGVWGASRPYYFNDYWERRGASRHVLDYALVHIPAVSGRTLGSVTGTYPVLLNSHTLQLPRTALGYPGEGWFSQWGGNYLWSCSSSDVRWHDWGSGWASKGSGCSANGGFSGGPVFEYYEGRWWVAGVNSSMSYLPAGGSRETHWLINLWSPSLNGWYDDLVAAVR